MPTKIAIVGFGPTAIFAARAAYDLGCKVEIFTDKARPMPPGATWLHWVPEDIAQEFASTPIYVVGKGTSAEYTKRQWGFECPSSFPTKAVWEHGYDPQKVLDSLLPVECNVNLMGYAMSDADVQDLAKSYDLVFQTFPTKESKEQQPALMSFVAAAKLGTDDPSQNWVVYNGTKEGLVVREASIFGNHFLEFPKNISMEEIKKSHPLSSDYKMVELRDLHPHTKPWDFKHPKIKLLGRWAQWDRKVLSHDAYSLCQKFIQELHDEPVE